MVLDSIAEGNGTLDSIFYALAYRFRGVFDKVTIHKVMVKLEKEGYIKSIKMLE